MKRYLRERGVSSKEIIVERDPKVARDLVRRTGQGGVPVIKIGNASIAGFDKDRIDRELAGVRDPSRLMYPRVLSVYSIP